MVEVSYAAQTFQIPSQEAGVTKQYALAFQAMKGLAPQAAIDAALDQRCKQLKTVSRDAAEVIKSATGSVLAAADSTRASPPASASAADFIAQIAYDYVWVQYRGTRKVDLFRFHSAPKSGLGYFSFEVCG